MFKKKTALLLLVLSIFVFGYQKNVDAADINNVLVQKDVTSTATDSSGSYLPGETVTYSITITNNDSPEILQNIVIEDNLGVLVYSSSDNGGIYDSINNKVTWNLPDINPGDSVTVNLITTVPANATGITSIDNKATSRFNFSSIGGPLSLKDSNTVSVGVIQSPTPTPDNVVLTKAVTSTPTDASGSYLPGETITYTLTIENKESVDILQNVEVTDYISVLEYVSSDNGGVYDSGTKIVTWNLPDINPGTSVTINLEVKVPADIAMPVSSISNVGVYGVENKFSTKFGFASGGLAYEKESAGVFVSVKDDKITTPKIELKKEVIGKGTTRDGSYIGGDVLTYTLTVTNNETEGVMRGLKIFDNLDDNVAYMQSDRPLVAEPDLGQLVWDIGELNPGESVTVTVSVVIGAFFVGDVTNQFGILTNISKIETNDYIGPFFKLYSNEVVTSVKVPVIIDEGEVSPPVDELPKTGGYTDTIIYILLTCVGAFLMLASNSKKTYEK